MPPEESSHYIKKEQTYYLHVSLCDVLSKDELVQMVLPANYKEAVKLGSDRH
ncbi:hypothetical protein KIN20_025053 [Parelaphostrongylus tenuis]|uniref:Uncharacterized protein n=1 Tax=Parelaphostrongylus tenuis TaxID=148309 RepID=A0AAD5MUH7_PARTN|nr:hypothetical protein KIN20_025053 [Parelaphostrongylus tenuis]